MLRIYEAIDTMNIGSWTLTDTIEIIPASIKEPRGQYCLAWCPSKFQPAMLVIGCGRDQGAKIFRLDAQNHWQAYESLGTHEGIVRDVAWAPSMGRSYQLIATASSDGHVRIYQLTTLASKPTALVTFK
jgi:nucleoporin SEH1